MRVGWEERIRHCCEQRGMPNAKEKAQILAHSFALISVVAVALTSCAVVFVGPYDEVTDKAINDLETKMELFLAKMEATAGSYGRNKAFYQESKAAIRAIRLRAELYGKDKNKGELDDLDKLDQNLDNLADLHRAGPLSGKAVNIARAQIETNFQSLIQIELAKKRSSGISQKSS
jgi:hypothetical protein